MRSLCLTFAALAALLVAPATPTAAQVATPAPVVERLEPTSGPPGTVVQLVGRHFRSDARVFLGASELEVQSRLPNRWVVVVPAGAATGHVEVRLADGRTITGPEFAVTAALPSPSIASVEPSAAHPGGEVRLRGEHFSARLTENTVTLNGRPVVVRSASPTELSVTVPPDGASGPFVVRVAGAGEATSPPLTVTAGLTITALEPAVAAPGMQVVVRGTGFSTRARDVRVFVGALAARLVSATETALTVELPARAATGTVMVELRGGGRVTSEATLTVRAMPSVTSFEPVSGPVGALIRVRGGGFGADVRAVRASIGGVAMTVRAVSEAELSVEIPAGASTGPVSVEVAGLPAVASAAPLTVLVPLTVGAFTPTNGPAGGEVVIAGTGFSAALAENRVTLAGLPCEVVAVTPTELRVRVPETTSGPLVVDVVNAGSARTSRPFVVTHPPVIEAMAPAQGMPGTVVRLSGRQFGENPALVEVTLGGARLELRAVTPTSIEAVVPAGAASGPLTVNVRLQGVATSSAPFRVLGPFSVAALEGVEAAHAGRRVTVRGEGFDAGTRVRFTGSAADARVRVVSRTELSVAVPDDAASGPLTVRADDGREAATAAFAPVALPSGLGVLEVLPDCTHAGCRAVVLGWGFATSPGRNAVTVGGARARVRRATRSTLEILLPRGTPSGPVHVGVRGVGEADGPALTMTAD